MNVQQNHHLIAPPEPQGRRIRSLRQHLMARALIGLVPLVLAAGFATYEAAQGYASLFQRKLEQTANGLSLALDAQLGGLEMMLGGLAQAHSLIPDPATLRVFAQRSALTAAQHGSWLRGFGPDEGHGHPVWFDTLNPDMSPVPVQLPPDPALEQTFATARPHVGNVAFDPEAQRMAVSVYVPVIRQGHVVAVLSGALDGVALSEHMAAPMVSENSLAAVLDGNADYVMRSRDAASLVGKPSPFRPGLRAFQGRPFIPTGVHMDGLNWAVAVTRPALAPGWTVIVAEPTRDYQLSWVLPLGALALGTAAASALAVLVAMQRTRSLAMAMVGLTAAARAVARGEISPDTTPRTDVLEFETLRNAIATAQSRLQQEARAARAGRALLQSVIDNLPDAVFVRDEAGRYVLVNEAAIAMIRAGNPGDGNPVIGQSASDLVPEPLRELIARTEIEMLRSSRPVSLEHVMRLPSGETRRHLSVYAPWREPGNDAVRGSIIISHDITGLSLAEQRLREQREEMQALARRATIGAMAGGLAHELSQPLTAVGNYLGTVLRMLDTMPRQLTGAGETDRIRVTIEAARRAAAQAAQASGIVRSFRDFVATRGPARRQVQLADVVAEGVRLGLTGNEQDRIAVDIDIAPDLGQANVDRVQIQQVLVNLLRNAIEALDRTPGAQLSVCARRLASSAGGVEIRIADNGPGVPPNIVPRLFEPFASSKADGLGLGLFICRSIIEAHGGQLGLDMTRHPGACFVVQFG